MLPAKLLGACARKLRAEERQEVPHLVHRDILLEPLRHDRTAARRRGLELRPEDGDRFAVRTLERHRRGRFGSQEARVGQPGVGDGDVREIPGFDRAIRIENVFEEVLRPLPRERGETRTEVAADIPQPVAGGADPDERLASAGRVPGVSTAGSVRGDDLPPIRGGP